MLKRFVLLASAALLCAGGTCTIDFGQNGDGSGTPLDQAAMVLLVRESSNGASADVTATLTDRHNRTLTLSEGQKIEINGTALSGPDGDGGYKAALPAAAAYTITVTEPTRGVQDTNVVSAGAFNISAPTEGQAASLSGFMIAWGPASASLKTRIQLTQTLFGRQRTTSFGPDADTGERTLGVDDLKEFQQGAALQITVTRTNEVDAVSGLREATVTISASRSVSVNPAP